MDTPFEPSMGVQGFGPPDLCENKFVLFEATKLVAFVTAALGNQY